MGYQPIKKATNQPTDHPTPWFFSPVKVTNRETRPNTRRSMRLAVVREKALRTDGPMARGPDGPMDGRTDLPSYRDATAHLKSRTMTLIA